ncbi:MAG TPA: serine protease [Planctomycetaceae bacterium]|nr:serine protease [Planctomycetaceae bacterium]
MNTSQQPSDWPLPEVDSKEKEFPNEPLERTTSLAASNPSPSKNAKTHPSTWQLAGSTLISLMMVLVLFGAARLLVPALVEDVRYRWYRGQLRAEYELAGERLQTASLDSLVDVSQLVSKRLGGSVVHINILRDEASMSQFQRVLGRSDPNLRYEGQGSGFVIDSQGYILTNHHVITETDSLGNAIASRVEVTLADGKQLPAEIIGTDPKTDLAVLKVHASNLMPVDWGDSDQVTIGTPVWAVGSPFGLQQSVTFGIISGTHRIDLSGTRYQDSLSAEPVYGDLMQSDVAVNPGNSGGPLVNSVGQVVGVNAAILGESYRGISFAIPSRVAKRVAEHLIQSGEVPRGWLGVRMDELAYDQRYGSDGQIQPGVRVVGFPDNEPSPARQAGLEVGDIFVEFQDKPVLSQTELMKLIGETEVGSPTRIVVLRNGQKQSFAVTLGKRNVKL